MCYRFFAPVLNFEPGNINKNVWLLFPNVCVCIYMLPLQYGISFKPKAAYTISTGAYQMNGIKWIKSLTKQLCIKPC